MTSNTDDKPGNGSPPPIDPKNIPEHLHPKSQTGGGQKLSALRDQLEKAKAAAKQAQAEAEAQDAELPAMTVASTLGEIVWLMSQSPTHKHFAISDLEWMIMPPVLLRQFKIFRSESGQPIGLALWAYLSKESEEKLEAGSTRLRPDEWNATGKLQKIMSGQADDPLTSEAGLAADRKEKAAQTSPAPGGEGQGETQQSVRPEERAEAGVSKDGTRLWLVDLIAPFGGQEEMLKDLSNTLHKDVDIRFVRKFGRNNAS
ncbi:MAG: toxin-activating lysine-acyltransferase [Alphaproteobacteria bacterium]